MKKTLLWLVVLLLALSPAAQAVTFTDVDIQYPIFPWGEHTLQLSRYTDDPDLIAYSQPPHRVRWSCSVCPASAAPSRWKMCAPPFRSLLWRMPVKQLMCLWIVW